MTGPRSDPPIPMFTTAVIGRPVKPRHSPDLICLANAAILPSTWCTSATTSVPSTISVASFGIRRATCRTERFSVVLIRSPENIASIRPARSDSAARSASRAMVSSVIRFFE